MSEFFKVRQAIIRESNNAHRMTLAPIFIKISGWISWNVLFWSIVDGEIFDSEYHDSCNVFSVPIFNSSKRNVNHIIFIIDLNCDLRTWADIWLNRFSPIMNIIILSSIDTYVFVFPFHFRLDEESTAFFKGGPRRKRFTLAFEFQRLVAVLAWQADVAIF